MDGYAIFYSSVDGLLACFHLLANRNNVAMNICVYIFVWTCVFISPGCILRSRIAGSCHNSKFLRNCYCFPKYLHYFTFPPVISEGSNFSISSSTPIIVVLIFVPLVSVKWYHIMVLICISLWYTYTEHLCMYLLTIHISMSIQLFCLFKKLGYKIELYEFLYSGAKFHSRYVICMYFPHSVGGFFTFLIIFFV